MILSTYCLHCGERNNMDEGPQAVDALCGRCDRRVFEGRPIAADEAAFHKHTAPGFIPAVVMFWLMQRDIRFYTSNFDKCAALYEPRARFLTVSVDDLYALARSHNVMSAPTLAVFRDGRLVERHIGLPGWSDRRQSADLRNWLNAHIGSPQDA
ncbi:MAG: hypothetical protein J7521_09905 [Caulobacter sp.]|nr:hypothetical protein [Caulobacter sp.]